MATRSELFRYEAERSKPKKTKAPARPRGRGDGTGEAAQHNASPRAGKHAAYALETSAGRPSRKSSRKAANRQKTDIQFRMKRKTGEMRPEARPGVGGRQGG